MISPDEPDKATGLAAELGRLRRRGLANVDIDNTQQPYLNLPALEALITAYSPTDKRLRGRRIHDLLVAALDAYAVEQDAEAAALVRRLFFTDAGAPPTAGGGPTKLLLEAQQAADLDEEQFRQQRGLEFTTFAGFLDGFVPRPAQQAEPEPAAAPPSGRWFQRSAVIVSGGLLAAVMATVITGLVVTHWPHHHSPAGTANPTGSTTTPTTQTALPKFEFDNLGSTYSNIFNVYPGVSTSTADHQPNGTFPNGEIVDAVCVTTGREVSSDPKYREQPKRSDQWVRLDAVSGVVQYATLTYGKLVPASGTLPKCAGN